MAGRFSVEAVFKAVDRMTAPISRMQNRVGKFTRGMERNLRRVNAQVNKITGAIGGAAGRIVKFGGAMLGAVGGATAVALQNTADKADALAKQARRLQFPIGDLQEWKFVAEQSGVSNELLDKSLGAFTKRLGEAKAGTGPLVAGLKKINPELLEQLIQTESVAEAFDIYIGAMRGAESATEKAALANAAFSRAGLDLVNIADNSTEAINALRLEQRQNGNITQQQAEAAEAYNDAVNSLKKSLSGLLHGVLLPMMPAITGTLRQWREWIVANRELVQERVTRFMTDLKDRVLSLVRAVVEFSQKYDLAERIGEGLDILGRFGRYLSDNGGLILKVVAGVVALSTALKLLIGIMAAVNLVMAANPITWIVLGIVALIAAIAAAIIYWDEIKAVLISFGQAVVEKVISVFEWLKETFTSLPGPVKAAIAIISGPIGWLIGAAALIMENWEPIKDFFVNLWGGIASTFDAGLTGVKDFSAEAWDGIVGIFNAALEKMTAIVDAVKGKATAIVDTISNIGGGVARFFGFGDDEEATTTTSPQVVSPEERVARNIEEQRTTSAAEVTIRDETGRAEVTGGQLGPGLALQPSGAF